MLAEVEVRAAVDALHFLETEGHVEFDVRSCIGIVCQFFVVVETVVFSAESQGLMPCHACGLPFFEPFEFGSGLYEELHFHLFELTHAEDELACYDFVAESLSDLCDAEGHFHASGLLHVEVVDEDTLCGFRTEVYFQCSVGGASHFGGEHEVELADVGPVASAADGADDFLVEDNLAEFLQVGVVHGFGKAFVQCVALGLILQYTGVCGAELRFVKGLSEAFASLCNLLLNLLVVFGNLVFDKDVGAVALFAVAVVDEGVVEGVYVSAGLPDGGMHEDGAVDADDVLVEQSHGLPPILLDIVLQLHTVLTVVVNGTESVVDVAGREHKTVFLAV